MKQYEQFNRMKAECEQSFIRSQIEECERKIGYLEKELAAQIELMKVKKEHHESLQRQIITGKCY